MEPVDLPVLRVRHRGPVGDALLVQRVGRGDPGLRDDALGTRDVDVGALSGAGPLHQRRSDVERRVDRTGGRALTPGLGPTHGPDARGGVEEPVVTHRPGVRTGERVHHLAMGRDGGIRTRSAVARVLAVDDVGLARTLFVVPDPETIAGVGRVPVDEHVGGIEEAPEDLETLRLPQVDGDAALVPVDLDVRWAVTRHDLAEEVAQVVTDGRRFDLDAHLRRGRRGVPPPCRR